MRHDEAKPCVVCEKGLAKETLIFFSVHIQSQLIRPDAVQRAHGLELMTDSPVIARVLGPNEELAVPAIEGEAYVCFNCAVHRPLAEIWEHMDTKPTKEAVKALKALANVSRT